MAGLGRRYEKVFVAMDGTEAQVPVFRRAVEVAARNEAALVLGQVVDMSKYDLASTYDAELVTQVVKYAEDELGKLADEAREAGVKDVKVIVKYGVVRQTIVEEIIEPTNPDLVICGDRGLNRVQYVLVGSVSNYIVHRAKCDVLVVKDKPEED